MFLSLEVEAVPLFLRNGFCGALRLSLAVAVAADAVNAACGLGLLFERRNALEHFFDRFGELVAEDLSVGVSAAVAVGKGQHIVDRIHRDALLDRLQHAGGAQLCALLSPAFVAEALLQGGEVGRILLFVFKIRADRGVCLLLGESLLGEERFQRGLCRPAGSLVDDPVKLLLRVGFGSVAALLRVVAAVFAGVGVALSATAAAVGNPRC